MARPCPACRRPNGDEAYKCLYCQAPLSAASAPEPEGSSAGASSPERFLVVLIPSPGGAPTDEQVRAFSGATGTSLYDARLRLSADVPRLYQRLDSEEEARSLSRELTFSEIPHYVVSERAISSLPVSKARGGVFHERHLELDIERARLALPYGDLLLLVRGEITRERHHEGRLGTARGVSRRLSPGLRLHLYPREASVAFEVDPETFDWSLLGSERTSSGLLELRALPVRHPGSGSVASRRSGLRPRASGSVSLERGG